MDEVWGWGQLVSGGFVEYVDTEEEETTLIAMTMKDLALQRDAVSILLVLNLLQRGAVCSPLVANGMSLECSSALRSACLHCSQLCLFSD
jgi:hypothetical protein